MPPDPGLAFSPLYPVVVLPIPWLTTPSWACRLLPRPLLETDPSLEPLRFFYLRAFLVEGEATAPAPQPPSASPCLCSNSQCWDVDFPPK